MSESSPWKRLQARIARYEADTEVVADEHGFRAAERIRRLERLRLAVEGEIDREILRAREQGASFGTLGFRSRQAAHARWRAARRRQRQ
jgi:hypothetical protein